MTAQMTPLTTADISPGITASGATVRVGKVPVTLHWTFLALMAFLAFWTPLPVRYGLMLAGVALVGILWHEAGHAVAFAAIGRRSRIMVHGMGGVTIPDDQAPMTDIQTVAVSVAGPLAGIVVGLIALAIRLNEVAPQHNWSTQLLADLILVNLGWGVLNLIPIVPLDGGHVFETLCNRLFPGLRHILPYAISIAIAIAGGIVGWIYHFYLTPLVALALVALNVFLMRDHSRDVKTENAIERVDAALAQLSSSHPGDAIDSLRLALSTQLPDDAADRAALGLAWALAWRAGPYDSVELAALIHRLVGRRDTAFLAAARADQAGSGPEARAMVVRGFAMEGTPPPQWLVARILPTAADVTEVAEWIDQLSLAERHAGLGRLVASLESSGRPADANSVRARLARPIAVPATAGPSR